MTARRRVSAEYIREMAALHGVPLDPEAVERTLVLAPGDLGLGALRVATGLPVHHRDEGVERGLEPVDPVQGGVDQLHRGDLALPDEGRRLGDGREGQLVAAHFALLLG